MAIPDFQSIMLPLLEFASIAGEHSLTEARDQLAKHYSLTDEELSEMLPSRRAPTFYNRLAWAKTYLQRAKLLSSPRRGRFEITPRGTEVLESKPERLSISYLTKFPEFREFRAIRKKPIEKEDSNETSNTPEEQLEISYQQIRDELAEELLAKVKAGTPEAFEQLVVELLLLMGYGGSRLDAGRAIGRIGDEGIDGVINEDRLGLDVIYLQAKKWDGTVGRPEIQKFVGALHGKRAKKGVFLTTGTFSSGAKEYISTIDPKVVLIDGSDLAYMMFDFGLGVTTISTYEFKKIDLDYFDVE